MRRRAVVLVGVLLAVCCMASAVGGLAYRLWPRPVAKPVVLINSPGYGEQVDVGERVAIRAIARDEAKVTLVELWVDVELTRVEARLAVEARVGGRTARAEVDGTHGVVRLRVPEARLWWPRGYGEQPLYDLELMLAHGDEVLDTWHRRIGFRTVELDRRHINLLAGIEVVYSDKEALWVPGATTEGIALELLDDPNETIHVGMTIEEMG